MIDKEKVNPEVWLVDPSRLRPARMVPPLSKSDAHRALVLAHVLGRRSWVGLPGSRTEVPADVYVLEAGLKELSHAGSGPVDIDCRDGGAPFRLLVGQAAISPGTVVNFRGTQRLAERPHQPLFDSLLEALGPWGLSIEEGSPWPIVVRGTGRTGEPCFRVAGAQSSQYVTSLLLAAAALYLREGRTWTVELAGPTASLGYIDLTLQWLVRMGFVTARTLRSVAIHGWSEPESPPDLPGDWSSLAYLLLVAWRSGGTVGRVDLSALHPDRAIVKVLEGVGLKVERRGKDEIAVTGEACSGAQASGAECPDLLPTVAALACTLPGSTYLSDVGILRGKESDRLQGIMELVRAAGGGTTIEPGGMLRIDPGPVPDPFEFDSMGDHRLAMAAATLSVLSGKRVRLTNPDCVGKSFPAFWAQLQSAGVVSTPMWNV